MKNDGGPAFPTFRAEGFGSDIHDGMSLRDWLAGQIAAGGMAHPKTDLSEISGFVADEFDTLAKIAYAAADAMLAEREKGNDSPS